MKLIRLKITDPRGFRSLAPGFEYRFRTESEVQEELQNPDFQPFVCAGRNGSGKSNLLEALASIFFQLEAQRLQGGLLPPALRTALRIGTDDDAEIDTSKAPLPNAYEIEYISEIPQINQLDAGSKTAHVKIEKTPKSNPHISWKPRADREFQAAKQTDWKFLLPAYVVGYSSGENEILSLPFFKMRFVQFDEYWSCLSGQSHYSGQPDARLSYLDSEYSQAILLCNLLFQNPDTLKEYAGGVGIQGLKQFQIRIKYQIPFTVDSANSFAKLAGTELKLHEFIKQNAALREADEQSGHEPYELNPIKLLDGDIEKEAKIIVQLSRCATLVTLEEASDDLVLDYWVNEATREAFQVNFESALELFQAFQVLLNLNLYSVSDELKDDLYKSSSHYVNETIPVLPSDKRIMRFKEFFVAKKGVAQPLLLKELSDGEHQLLHSLGMCLLFRGTNSVFLLDEPETHFNPDWRAQFISRLRNCLATLDSSEQGSPEMLISTHTPFLISDSRPEKVLIFNKDESSKVTIEHPGYNTLGASINKITLWTFDKQETIGAYANSKISEFRESFEKGDVSQSLVNAINKTLGDSIEKTLLIKKILDQGHSEANAF